jgi:YD repeat-containing protein
MLSETLSASYFGAGRSVQWQRDAYGRRSRVAFHSGGSAQFTHDYGYDGATGRLMNMAHHHQVPPAADSEEHSHGR